MKRVTILHRFYWKPSRRAGSSQVYEVCALHDLTDKQLSAKLNEMNCRYKTSTWSIKHDFHLDRKADQKEYLQYCISCYYEPYTYDFDSSENGEKMIAALKDEFPYFK